LSCSLRLRHNSMIGIEKKHCKGSGLMHEAFASHSRLRDMTLRQRKRDMGRVTNNQESVTAVPGCLCTSLTQ
jgi:hypothetical protein